MGTHLSRTRAFHSTYRDKRDLFVCFIVSYPGGLRVQNRLTIDQETILMMTMGERYLQEPPAIRAMLHGKGRRGPTVKIANQMDGFGVRCGAIEIHGYREGGGRYSARRDNNGSFGGWVETAASLHRQSSGSTARRANCRLAGSAVRRII